MSKRKHIALQKKRKAYTKRKKERLNVARKKYMFQEYLVNCEDAIAEMVPANGRIYRLAHDPNQSIDLLPTSLWNYNSLSPKMKDENLVIPPNSSLEAQQNQLREYTPSFNKSVEGVVGVFVGRLNKMKTEQQILNFKNRKGSHIFAYDITPKDGLMWTECSGHVSFLPYEGFSLKEHMTKGFTPIPIENYINSNFEK